MKSERMFGGGGAPQSGFSLIELMIAMVLGLIVAGAASAIYLSTKSAYNASESLGRIQESSRTSFELMARDIREAAGNPCSKDIPIVNTLRDPGTNQWWANWNSGLRGYEGSTEFADTSGGPGLFGTGKAQRVAGTDAIELRSGRDTGTVVTGDMPDSSANIDVSKLDNIENNDVIFMCDFNQAAIFQVTQLPGGLKIQHNSGAGSPGNCSKNIGYSEECDAGDPDSVCFCTNKYKGQPFGKDAVVAKLHASRWYVGCNARAACTLPAGRSLYQNVLRNDAGTLVQDANEIATGVIDMDLTYLQRDETTYKLASAITDWKNVQAVRIDVTLQGEEKTGVATDGAQVNLQRHLQHTVTLRNRMQ